MGYKEYYMVDLNQAMTLPAGLRDYADRLSSHPLTGKKRALHATRHDLAGAPCGHKMLWMTEATRPELATWAWNAVLSLQHDLGLPSGDNLRRMRRIVQGWRWSESCYVYPDLVSLNTDTEGRAERLLVYTSVK